MAQSTTDSNLRGIPAFWSNHTVEPPTQWTNWIDQFDLAISAKENLDIDNLKEPLELETTIPILEGAKESKNEPQRKAREARNKEAMESTNTQKANDLRGEEKIRRYEEIRGRQKSNTHLISGPRSWRKKSFYSKTPKG